MTDVTGNSEILEDNITGFIAAAPTAAHLDKAMERAWQHRHEWEAIGVAAAESIRRQIPEDAPLVFAKKLLAIATIQRH